MTLMDAQLYDEGHERRRRYLIILAVTIVLFLAWFAYHMRNHAVRHTVDRFFAALQHHDFEGAYGIWLNDPDWKQHPQQHAKYPFGDFYNDWGPPGEWGVIKSHNVDCSLAGGSGVIVQVTVNGRAERAFVYFDRADKTLHFSPNEIDCGNWYGWLTE